jgi:hypothetical protein
MAAAPLFRRELRRQIGSDEGLQRRLIDIILPIADCFSRSETKSCLGLRGQDHGWLWKICEVGSFCPRGFAVS